MHITWHAGTVLLFPALLAGCGMRAAQVGATPESSACMVSDDEPRSSLSVALSDAVDPDRAPVAVNAAERMVFRQLYETLVNLDCEGRAVPGLADAWATDDGGSIWQFRLRAGATFWDGEPVTTRDVLYSWNANRALPPNARAVALDARRLYIELDSARADPSLFAHPLFAVARDGANLAWRMGTGAFRPDTQDDARVIRLRARDVNRSIDFHVATADARRALDASIDALIAADPAVLAYARALTGYTSAPLTWSSTYALAARTAWAAGAPPSEALLALARDAVRGDARAVAPPTACVPAAGAAAGTSGPAPFILYARDDLVARGIAERLVALAWPAARTPAWLRTLLPVNYTTAGVPAARGVAGSALADSLRTRRALAYVVAVPRVAGMSCDHGILMTDPVTRALLESGLRVTPLIDTRDYLVHRSGLGHVVVDGDGALRFMSRGR